MNFLITTYIILHTLIIFFINKKKQLKLHNSNGLKIDIENSQFEQYSYTYVIYSKKLFKPSKTENSSTPKLSELKTTIFNFSILIWGYNNITISYSCTFWIPLLVSKSQKSVSNRTIWRIGVARSYCTLPRENFKTSGDGKIELSSELIATASPNVRAHTIYYNPLDPRRRRWL